MQALSFSGSYYRVWRYIGGSLLAFFHRHGRCTGPQTKCVSGTRFSVGTEAGGVPAALVRRQHPKACEHASSGQSMSQQAQVRCLSHTWAHGRRIRASRRRTSAVPAAVHVSPCGCVLTKDILSTRTLQRRRGPAADQGVGRHPDNFCRTPGRARHGCGRKRDAERGQCRRSNSSKTRRVLAVTDG